MQDKVQISEGSSPSDKIHFRTSDIALASTLRAVGHKLVDVGIKTERHNGKAMRKTEFIFMREGVTKAVLQFTNGELRVDPKMLLDQYRNLKSMSMSKGLR